MTDAQNHLYWREWQKVRRKLRETMTPSQADAERHALHIRALGHEQSSQTMTNGQFDKVLAVFRAISQPANARTQIALEEMPATRKRTYIAELLAALGEHESYAETIIARMQRNRKLSSTGAGTMLTLDTLQPDDLDKVKIALKKEIRRRWPKKSDLLAEIRTLRTEHDFPEAETAAAVMLALGITTLPFLDKLYYEPLLTVLATLRRLAAGTLQFPAVQTAGDPF